MMDPKRDEAIVAYEMYEVAGMKEYSGVRARLYASSANDCERTTRACPIPADTS